MFFNLSLIYVMSEIDFLCVLQISLLLLFFAMSYKSSTVVIYSLLWNRIFLFRNYQHCLNLPQHCWFSTKMSFTPTSTTNNSTQSKLPSTGNHNTLISLELDPQEIINMSEHERAEYFNKIKKQANYFLLNAFRALQQKNYKSAKDILVYIADSCSCIHPPDKQSEELIELCCQELAQIKRVQDWNQERKTTKNLVYQGSGQKKLELFVIKYNKFSGQFQCDQGDRKNVNTEVLFYLSKINAILFGQQTSQNIHSMVAMLKIYWFQILCTMILTMLLVLTELTDLKEAIFGMSKFIFNLPAFIIGVAFLIPLLIIFFKSPITKNSHFFQHKLTEQIKKINQQCRQKNKKILFMMPEGMELNVKVQHQVDEIKEEKEAPNYEQASNQGLLIDLSRIRKRVTHYDEKSKYAEGQIVTIK